VFVEAGKANRLDRLRRTRGWDEAELDRREACQLPLDQKKARSHYVIPNDGSPDLIRSRVTDVLTRILGEVSPDRPK
jgi:dephospho-CoA kinase